MNDYFHRGKRHPCYTDCCTLYNKWLIHSDGEFPLLLIGERRPNEPEHIFEYRKKIYEPITKEIFSSVFTSLMKIRRSTDWSINYPPPAGSVPKEDTLEKYCEEKFPHEFNSLTNWAFQALLKNLLIDPNGVVFVFPKEIMENEFPKPFPAIFNSPDVIEFTDELVILRSQIKPKLKGGSEGESFYVITKEKLERWYQVDAERRFEILWEIPNVTGQIPAWHLKGIFKESKDGKPIYESVINAMLPRLNEAAREYSDNQAEILQHIFSERWEYATQQCDACRDPKTGKSLGAVKKKDKIVYCEKCGGTGSIGSSPYKKIIVGKTNKTLGEDPPPMPPAGYIEKSTEIAKLQDERIDKHLYRALCAINMQFLMKTPLSESGIAKEVDRDELNNFVHSVAELLVWNMDKIYYFTNEWRFKSFLSNDKQRTEQLPEIGVPEKFDIISSTFLADEVKSARKAKLNPLIISELEVEYASKKFYNNPDVKDLLVLVLELDPLPGLSEDEKMVLLSNNGISQSDYVISSNIVQFVRRAIQEDKLFSSKVVMKQREVIEKYASELTLKIEESKPEPIPFFSEA